MKRILKKSILSGVVFKTDNIIIQKIQEGKNLKGCYIIGDGHSLSVDRNNKILKHDPYMKKNIFNIEDEYAVFAFYFTFECAGLEESSKDIAYFINNVLDDYENIYLVGHSKCGVCLTKTSYYCSRNHTLVTISSPFKGTLVTDKEKIYRIVKSRFLLKIYDKIFSDHIVDRDIMPNSTFIQNMKKNKSITHINITTNLNSLFSCRTFSDLVLFLWDRTLKINGDGIIPLASQSIDNTKEINIYCSHLRSVKTGIKFLKKELKRIE